jgi:zinc protease
MIHSFLYFCGLFNQDMPDRRTPPVINQVQNLQLPPTHLVHLDNGIPVHILHSAEHQVIKIEVLYWAGRPEESKRMVSRATSRLIREGTQKHKGAEIAEFFDFYGASFSVPTNLDIASFSLFSIKKHAPKVMPMFAEVLQEPVFPQLELDTFVRNSIHELQVELEKNEVLAYRKITELIFGENHPYGYNSVPADYTALTQQDLTDHYERWYTPGNCLILASGCVDEEVLQLLNQHFGKKNTPGQSAVYQSDIKKVKPTRVNIKHEGSLQTAIQPETSGLRRRVHPEYHFGWLFWFTADDGHS